MTASSRFFLTGIVRSLSGVASRVGCSTGLREMIFPLLLVVITIFKTERFIGRGPVPLGYAAEAPRGFA